MTGRDDQWHRRAIAALVVALTACSIGLVVQWHRVDAHPIVPVESVGTSTPAHGSTSTGTSVTDALRALDKLRSYGYTWSTDAGALRAVKHWQRVNGLEDDGIVGPITLASLRLTSPATVVATVPATRVTPPAPAPPPEPVSDVCAEMSAYRQAAGLPEVFDSIGYRESRCLNTVGNSCCFGWWANYLSSHLSSQSAYRDRIISECGVNTSARSQIQGDSDAQKRAQVCVTFVVWSVSGMSPWAL